MKVIGANIHRANKPGINQQVYIRHAQGIRSVYTQIACYQNTSVVRKHASDHTSTISHSSLGDRVISPLSFSYSFALETLTVIQPLGSREPLTSLVHAAPNDTEYISVHYWHKNTRMLLICCIMMMIVKPNDWKTV